MRINQYVAVLDTCVLAPMPVADTLLKLAAEPVSFYAPRWSPDILQELATTLDKFGFTQTQIAHRIDQMQMAFPDAVVNGYQHLLDSMKNHPKDRHVLAAAVRCGANCIVSNNKKHFPESVLADFDLECLTADEFIERQYDLNPDVFISVLKEQAEDVGKTLPQLISAHVPCLARLIVIKD
jgi:predicted nucleic acid-binding protein